MMCTPKARFWSNVRDAHQDPVFLTCDYFLDEMTFTGQRALSSSLTIIAGTSIVRTKNVSIKTPMATTKPNINNSKIGCVIRTAKVAAKMIPADEITPPVFARPNSIAFLIGCIFASSLIRESNIML